MVIIIIRDFRCDVMIRSFYYVNLRIGRYKGAHTAFKGDDVQDSLFFVTGRHLNLYRCIPLAVRFIGV